MISAWYKHVPDDQKLTITIVPNRSELVRAALIGGVLRSFARLMRVCGDLDGADFETFISSIEMGDDGSVTVSFVVLQKADDEGDADV